jgi:integrase
MGLHLTKRPPKYAQGFIDRHGKPRFYFRRPGFKAVPLPGLPWSPEFMTAYQDALAGQPAQIGASRVKPGTMRALAVSYYGSNTYRSMERGTQSVYRNIIEKFCRETDKDGRPYGDKGATSLQREHIVRIMAARPAGTANGLRKAFRAMMKHAVETGLRPDDPTRDVRAIRTKSNGHHSWSDDEINKFESTYPAGSRERLALGLLLYTGQRRGDVIRMGRQHIRNGVLQVKQAKTGIELDIPVHPDLQAIIDQTPATNLTFLVTRFGTPFTGTPFSNWFGEACTIAGISHCSAHGLRKAAARRLAEAGCTVHEIAAITGHATLKELVRYTKAADQKKLARAAIDKVSAKPEQKSTNLDYGLKIPAKSQAKSM